MRLETFSCFLLDFGPGLGSLDKYLSAIECAKGWSHAWIFFILFQHERVWLFLDCILSQSGPFRLWPAMSGNLPSRCAETHPLHVPPIDSHSALWDSVEHSEQFSPLLLFNLKFQVYRKDEGTVQLTQILFIYSPIIPIFPYLLCFISCFFFSSWIIWEYVANIRLHHT